MNDEITCPDCSTPFFGPRAGRELGGHRKVHNRHRNDVPACFLDPDDWDSAITRLRTEHPSMQRITRDFALAESCAACPLGFMKEMQAQNRCWPPPKAWPQRDIGDDGGEEAL